MTVTIDIDDSVVSTLSGSRFSGNIVVAGTGSFEQGVSGSLTRLADEKSYLVAGENITITSSSNGSITIASAGSSDKAASFVTLATNTTLQNERVLTAGTGITITDGGAKSAATVSLTNSWLAEQILRRLHICYSYSDASDPLLEAYNILIDGGGSVGALETIIRGRVKMRTLYSGTGNNSNAGWVTSKAGFNPFNRTDGFWFQCGFAFQSWTPTTAKFICGLHGSAVSTSSPITSTTQPSALVNVIGVGMDSSDTQLYIIHNDASGTATKVATGYTASTTTVYTIRFHCAASGNIRYCFRDLGAMTEVTGILTTDLVATTAMLRCICVGSTGATSGGANIQIGCSGFYANPYSEIAGVTSF